MPFFRHQVPVGWIIFNGAKLPMEDCYELWDALYYAENAVRDIWVEKLGGEVDSESITLPNVADARRAWELSYNMVVDGIDLPDMVLAIKAKRTVMSDAS